jgi:hypothetical protein
MDIVCTVPKHLWAAWKAEGHLPGDEESEDDPFLDAMDGYHFWISPQPLPRIIKGERVYIVSHGRLRGYSPLIAVERRCTIRPSVSCLLRYGHAEAVTIPKSIRGFRGWQYRSWGREEEIPFPMWRTEDVDTTNSKKVLAW